MKKIAFVLSLVMMLSVLAACGGTAGGVQAPADPLTDLFAKLYEEVTVELPVADMPVELEDPDMLMTYVGAESAEGIKEAQFSESMIGAQAYSVTLVRCEDNEAAKKVAQTMFDGINTRKWICVEATDKMAASYGDLAVFIMVDPELGVTAEQLMQGFSTVFGGEITDIIR